MRKFYRKGREIIEIEDFPDRRYIVWEYKESDQELSSNKSLNEKEVKKLIRKKKKEGFRLK